MSEYSHRILITVSLAVIIGLGVGLGISNLPSGNTTVTDTEYYGQGVQFRGTVLPFLSNASYIGKANSSQQIVIGFWPRSTLYPHNGTIANQNISENDFLNWERGVGLTPGMSNCLSSIGVTNFNGTVITTRSTGKCSVDLLETLTTIGQADTVFNSTIGLYSYHGQIFYANPTDPYLPSKIASYLVDIEGLNNYTAFVVGPVFS